MNNLKRAALNITSKFGLLNTHRTLVVAISEEREVHETILKLVLARVNASTSLLKWAKKEDNQIMKDTILRLYDISLMYASVQREFAEQSNKVTNSLKDILSYEVALEALEKRLKEVREKKEKLEKIASELGRRRSNVSSSNPDEMLRLKDEEDNLKKDLEAKKIQAEIFKSTSMKSSLMSVCEAHLKFAEKMSLIFTAAKEVISIMRDVPEHVKPSSNHQKCDSGPKCDAVVDLAKALNINKPLSSNMSNPSSIFHVELNRVELGSVNDIKCNQVKMMNKEDLKKTISNPVLLSPPPRPTISISREESDRPVIPPLPDFVHRRRSRTNDVFWSHVYATGNEVVPKRSSYGPVNEYDEIENIDLSSAESFGRLYRSASDSTISSSKTDEYRYTEPWEELGVEKEKVIQALDEELAQKTKSLVGIKYESLNPIEKFNEKGCRKYQIYGAERIYTEPIIESEKNHDERDMPHIDRNIEYVDNDLIHEPLKSKLDILENIVLTNNAPSPPPKPKPPKKMFSSASVRLPEGPKKVPPKPKPRPTTALYESATQIKTENIVTGTDNMKRSGVGSVREIAAQMSSKIQPASLIPSMTQAKLKEQENSEYQNINFS